MNSNQASSQMLKSKGDASSISNKVSSDKKNEEEEAEDQIKIDTNVIDDYLPTNYQKADDFNSREDDFELLEKEDLDTRIGSSLDPSLVASGIDLKRGIHYQ